MDKSNCTLCDHHCPLTTPQCFKGELLGRSLSDSIGEENYRKDTLIRFINFFGRVIYRRRGGMDSQKRILRILSHNESVSQKELQSILDIQAGSLSEVVTKLEQKGWLCRHKDTKDKRKVVLSITEEGRAAHAQEQEETDEHSRAMLDSLTEEEQQALLDIYLKLLPHWGKAGPRK